jgi:hypothetical protein
MSTLASYGSGVRMVATGSGKAVPHPVPSLLVRHAGPSLAAVQTTTTGHHNSSYPHVQHQYASWSSTLYALLFGSHQGAIPKKSCLHSIPGAHTAHHSHSAPTSTRISRRGNIKRRAPLPFCAHTICFIIAFISTTMADVSNGPMADGGQLRERPSAKPLHLHNSHDAKQKVLDLNDREDKSNKDDKLKRTYGRTPDGTGIRLMQSVALSSHSLVTNIPVQFLLCRRPTTWSRSCFRPRNQRTYPI